ncbi:MAG: hypothetical protein MRY49_01130 [Candidatus Pacebacteria bacterium]|nr:hypothetical protein [Candidatus Paceibacterota bacterium]
MRYAHWTLVLCLFALVGCGGYSKEEKKSVEVAKKELDDAKAYVQTQKAKYERTKAHEDFAVFVRYAEDENWDKFFQDASSEVIHAQGVYGKEILPVLERNDNKEWNQLNSNLTRIRTSSRNARDLAKKAFQRLDFLREVKKNAPEMIKKAEGEFQQVVTIVEDASVVTEKAKTDHVDSAKEIGSRFAILTKWQDEAGKALATSQVEIKREFPDYSAIGDSTVLVSSHLEAVKGHVPKYKEQIAHLYESYSKILEDMKVEYCVQVGRTSWDNSSDFNTENDYTYPAKQVSEEVYTYFAGLSDSTVLATGSSSPRVKINSKMWNALGISPRAYWPSSHDDAEWWISNVSEKYYHRYSIVSAGEQKTTDWVAVSEDVYGKHWEDLGMAILTKPFGVFEDDVIEEASPPGMALVGNSKYGEWKQDSGGGGSFWEFYGKYQFYSMLLGGNRYYHSEWDTWNRDYRGRGAYYGVGSNGYTRYGTYSDRVASSPRYSKSTFASQGGFKSAASDVKSGNFNASRTSTVRGAGASARGGGPGGSGK